ncbi:outer membrane protein assembly factor BamA [Helicobacter sp. 23-1046]
MIKRLVFALLLSFSATLCLGAQISAVKYQGSTSISDTLASEIANIKAGDTLDINKVDNAIKEFFKQGYYEDVYASFENGILTFHFKQRPKVASIEIKGYGSESEKESLYGQIGIKKGDSYDEVRLERAKNVIKTILEYQGYYGSVIKEEIQPVGSDEGAYAITLHINQGDNIIIKEATYNGREKLKVSEIQELSANKQKQFAGWFWGRNDGKLRLYDLEYDNARIQDSYMRRGFLDAQVGPAFLEADFSDYSAKLRYDISEGEQYKVSDVQIIIQSPQINEKKLLKKLRIQKGDVFNIENLRADMEIIKYEIADMGYAFTRVSPDLDKDSTNAEVRVLYYIQAGQKVRVNDVIISGNTRTGDRIIRRELLLSPGDEYNLTQIKNSENALRRLGFFEKVEIEERRVSEDYIDLLVNVQEQRTGELMFGFGYGSYDKLMINASIRERNLFGTGHSGQLYADWSAYRQIVNLTLVNPRILDSAYSESVSLFVSNYYNWQYRERTTGATINVGRLITETFRVSLGYTLSKTIIDFPDQRFGYYYSSTNYSYYKPLYEQYFASKGYEVSPLEGPIKSAITPSLSFDNTDDYYFPKNGIIASAYGEVAGVGFLGFDEKYVKLYGKFAGYKHLKNLIGVDVIARYKMQIGGIYDLGHVPITSRFYMGGINSVRGYYVSSLTPYEGELRVGGNYINTHSVELSFGLLEKAQMRLAVFFDYGMIGIQRIDETQRSSWGLALEWVSPMGPIVIVFPRAINPGPNDAQSSFEFTMGTRF